MVVMVVIMVALLLGAGNTTISFVTTIVRLAPWNDGQSTLALILIELVYAMK